MRLRYLLAPIAVLALAFAFTACGGSDDDDNGGDDGGNQPADTTAPADTGDNSGDDGGNDGGNNGGGSAATLTIGNESWEFASVFCAFSTEETQQQNVPFTVSGFTTSSTGARAQMDASIVDLTGLGDMSPENLTVTLDDVEDFENPSVSWADNSLEIFGGSTPELNIDGKNVTINAVFDDNLTEDETEAIPGTLVASCP